MKQQQKKEKKNKNPGKKKKTQKYARKRGGWGPRYDIVSEMSKKKKTLK